MGQRQTFRNIGHPAASHKSPVYKNRKSSVPGSEENAHREVPSPESQTKGYFKLLTASATADRICEGMSS
ncbi:MAG: hypothetical protein DRH97_07830 [Chloroflexi bacterium]|nr:MAG: hypothetical protein DRH97_07830 [Chloroflexota bacterium]